MIVAVRADMAVGSGSESYEVPMAGVVLIRCLCRLRFKKKVFSRRHITLILAVRDVIQYSLTRRSFCRSTVVAPIDVTALTSIYSTTARDSYARGNVMNWLVVAWNGESPCLCRHGRLFRVGRMIAPTSSYPNPNP